MVRLLPGDAARMKRARGESETGHTDPPAL